MEAQDEKRIHERGALIPATECAGLLKRAIFSNARVRLSNRKVTWQAVFIGEIGYDVDDYEIVFHKRRGHISYVDSMMTFDARRTGEFFQWETNPFDLLTVTERALLEGALGLITK